MTQIDQILENYNSENPGVRQQLYRLLNHGALGGTGKLVILPVDQGFEHGPTRSFASNPEGYCPRYHAQLAIDSGCSALAAPLGFIETCAHEFAGQIPLILKVNNSDSLYSNSDGPVPAMTSHVKTALRLGCIGIGFTIYPGSSERKKNYEDLSALVYKAKKYGLLVVVWSYPRGEGISKKGETAVDVVSYAAQIACQLGAHIIKVKPPTEMIECEKSKKIFSEQKIPIAKLSDRVKHVIRSSFDGQRIVIFSGGESKETSSFLSEVKELKEGGAFGSIIGRNAFQRSRQEALSLFKSVTDIYKK